MAITVIEPSKGSGTCGFCSTGHHDRCAIGTKNAGPRQDYPEGSVHLCLCESGGCTRGRRKCAYCNNRVTEEVNPETWECFDTEACRAIVETRREANPLTRQLREAKESAAMAKIEDNKTKAEKAAKTPKVGACVCCGGATKGGNFLPGHDARFVSGIVGGVVEANFSKKAEDAGRKTLKDAGASEKLVAKFDKSLGLAREKADKAAEAAKAKADAKKEKAASAA